MKDGGNGNFPNINCMNRKWCCEIRGSARSQCSKYYRTLSWKQMCSPASFYVWGIFSKSSDQTSLTTKARVSFFHFLLLRKDNSFLLTFFFFFIFSFGFLAASRGLSTGSRSSELPTAASFLQHCHGQCNVFRGSLQVTGWAEGCQLLLNVSSTRATRKVCGKLRLVFNQ